MSALICLPDYFSMCISMHARPSRKRAANYSAATALSIGAEQSSMRHVRSMRAQSTGSR